jgi:peroxiredoxin
MVRVFTYIYTSLKQSFLMKYFLLSIAIISSITLFAQAPKTNAPKTTAKPAAQKPVAKTAAATSSSERNISITYTPYKNCWLYLGSYYGNGKVLVDSAKLDAKSKGNFKGKKLTGGIYFVVSPEMSIQFEFLVGAQQTFSVVGDSTNKENITITGSTDNTLFKQYSAYSTEKGRAIAQINQQLSVTKDEAIATNLRKEKNKLNIELQNYRDNIIKQNANSLLATLLTTMKVPEPPAIPVVNGKPDSTYPYRFVKEHFWDGVNFNDDRLLRTPFFEKKLDDYFKYYVSPESDSIIKEVKYILLYARTGKEIYPYLLTKFTNKYINPEYMGQDKVFLYLFTDFYAKGDTTILNAASRKMIFERAYSMMANQLGNPAPLLDLTDTTGQIVSLYNVKAKFTVVVFWDPTCGHCKEEIPRLDSAYKAKWKEQGVKVYSVIVKEDLMKELKGFLKEKNISNDWLQVYQTKAARDAEVAANQANYHQLYDVYKTPTFYLLDEEKRIIGKQLSLEQFDDLIKAKLKKQTSTNN